MRHTFCVRCFVNPFQVLELLLRLGWRKNKLVTACLSAFNSQVQPVGILFKLFLTFLCSLPVEAFDSPTSPRWLIAIILNFVALALSLSRAPCQNEGVTRQKRDTPTVFAPTRHLTAPPAIEIDVQHFQKNYISSPLCKACQGFVNRPCKYYYYFYFVIFF